MQFEFRTAALRGQHNDKLGFAGALRLHRGGKCLTDCGDAQRLQGVECMLYLGAFAEQAAESEGERAE